MLCVETATFIVHEKMPTIQKRINKRSRTFLTLFYWGKIIGLNPLQLSANNELTFSYFSVAYTCFLCLIFCVLYYHVCKERINLLLPIETPVSIIADCFEIINVGLETLFTWLINGFFQNRLKLIVESFRKAEETSRKLNIEENCEKHFTNLGAHLIFVNAWWFLLIAVNSIGLSRYPEFSQLLWATYNLLRIPTFNSVAIFLWIINVTKRKFHRLNEKVRFLMLHDHAKFHDFEETPSSSGLIRNSSFKAHRCLSDEIDIVSQQRRDLLELVNAVLQHYNFLVLMCIMAHFPTGMLNVYLAYRSLEENELKDSSDWFYTFSFTCWFLFPVITLLVISNVCGSTVNEANETGNVLHGMLINYENFHDPREIAKFNMLSFELLQNPLKISLFGLVDLDHWMVYRILATGATYFVIMLQFYN